MRGLYVYTHDETSIAIEDLQNDLNISENKWNFIFDFLLKQSDAVYFKGFRFYFKDEDFTSTINYVADEILAYDGKDYFGLLFRLKPSSLIYNRNLVSKLWEYYEYPTLIFLKDQLEENDLIDAFNNGMVITEDLESVYIIYRSFQQNVLWVKSSYVAPPLAEAFDKFWT